MLGGLFGGDSFLEGVGSATGAGLASMLSSAMSMVSEGIGGLSTRLAGKTTNPNMELAFESVPFRSFNFPFTFAPKNHQELAQVHKIIETFKFHMLPEIQGDVTTSRTFVTPDVFDIKYMISDGKENEYINKIKVIRVWSYMAPNSGFIKRIFDFLVSSAKTKSTFFKVSIALYVMSSKFPIGVGTINNFPLFVI